MKKIFMIVISILSQSWTRKLISKNQEEPGKTRRNQRNPPQKELERRSQEELEVNQKE